MRPRIRFWRTGTFFNVIPSSCRKAARNIVSQDGRSSCAFNDGTPLTTILLVFKEAERESQTCWRVGTGCRGSRRLMPRILSEYSLPLPAPPLAASNTLINCSGRRVTVTLIEPSESIKKTVSRFSSAPTIRLTSSFTSRMPSAATMKSIVCNAPCKIFMRIPSSSGKFMRGVPDSPIILQFFAPISNL